MCKDKNIAEYKFTKNTVNLHQYFKNIDAIHSIIIVGNTYGICGTFDFYDDSDWEEPVPNTSINNNVNAGDNIDFIESLIDNKCEILIVCNNADTKIYWETVYHYFCVLKNTEEIRNFRMINSIEKNEDYESVMKDIIERKKKNKDEKKHKFDVGFINAPYDNGLHRKFESMMFNLCNNKIVWVGPTNFFKTNKPDEQDNALRSNMEKYETTVLDINGNDFFDAATPTNMGIITVNMQGEPGIIYKNEKYNSCAEAKDPYLKKFEKIITSLFEKDNVNNHINTIPTSRFKSYRNYNPDQNGYVYKFPRAAGDNHRSIEESPDYYTIVQAGQHNGKLTSIETYDWFIHNDEAFNAYIPMNNKKACKNMQKYLTGYFTRFALMLDKNSYDLMSGSPTKTIPWFDFNDSMFNGTPEEIDIALFKKYNISQKIVDHILEILPNYYGLNIDLYKNIYNK